MFYIFGTLAVLTAGYTVLASPVTDYTIGLKTLVLYTTPDDQQVARLVLDGYGTRFELSNRVPDLSTPKWHSIVVTDDSFNDGDFSQIRNYASTYNVRIAFLNSRAGAEVGVSTTAWEGPENVVFDNSTFATQIGDIMNVTGYWDVSADAQEAKAVQIYDTARTTAFMRYTTGTSRVGEGPVAAFITKMPDGHEEMHFTFFAGANELCDGCEMPLKDMPVYVQHGEYTKLSLALGNVWFQWVTKGVYLGQRRIYMQMHVDDWFAATDVYNSSDTFRINGTDVEYAVQWARNAAQSHKLAPGSFIRFEPAFNGAGHSAFALERDGYGVGLNDATNKHLGEFNWISHTWTHQQLDWLDQSECGGKKDNCPLSANRIDAELKANQMLARGEAVNATVMDPGFKYQAFTPAGQMFYNQPDLADKVYSPSCLVTPEISGLRPKSYNWNWWNKFGGKPFPGNVRLMQGMWARGIRAVVGDNSRRELMSNESCHHGIITTVAEYGVDGLIIIPRWAVNVAFNTHTVEKFLEFYNNNKVCQWSFGPACEQRAYTLEEAMFRQAQTTTIGWLQYRADPFMFHQANLHFFPYKGGVTSLLSYWADHSLDELTRYVTGLPVTSPKMEITAEHYRQRTNRDRCNIDGVISVQSGKPSAIEITSSNQCTALLTIRNTTREITPVNETLPVEIFGPDRTFQIALGGVNSTTVIAVTEKKDESGTAEVPNGGEGHKSEGVRIGSYWSVITVLGLLVSTSGLF